MTNLNVTGLDEAIEALPRQRKFLDLGLVRRHQKIADIAEEDHRQNFATEGRQFGSPWPRLVEQTMDHREYLAETWGLAIAPDHPILVNFGHFRESIVEKHGVDHERRVDQFTVRIATTHSKPGMDEAMADIVHAGKGNAPPRRILHPDGASRDALRKMERELEEHAEVVAKLTEGGSI